jgi:hypothetical protein
VDIYCPKCGEPWEVDTLHEQIEQERPDLNYSRRGQAGYASAEDYGRQYPEALAAVREKFYRDGCRALGGRCSEASEAAQTRAAFSAALHDVLGDDVDGIASELDDAEALGWI